MAMAREATAQRPRLGAGGDGAKGLRAQGVRGRVASWRRRGLVAAARSAPFHDLEGPWHQVLVAVEGGERRCGVGGAAAALALLRRRPERGWGDA